MKPVTPAKKIKPTLKRACLLCLFLPLSACRQERDAETVSGTSVRFAHLQDYAWQDRTQSGQPVDMKPLAEREALLLSLSTSPADILVLRGLGSEASLLHLQSALSTAGTPYPSASYVPGTTPYRGIGFLSQAPLSETRNLSDQQFRIKEQSFQPLAGALLTSSPHFPRIWIWNHQAPDPDKDYERRRNEARMLSQALRPLLEAGDQVLLSIHSREDLNSPMLRMLEDLGLQRLQLTDERGDSWTFRDPQGIHYRQDQWLFASPELLDQGLSNGRVIDSPSLREAGPYRHQGIVIL
ncbi:hypothetical protein P3T73_05190 [Kiritimatiellota bacterium B12222]|nr:hypothetical protein P3T73_05190 [Kiritimatiellota bacterium B12222]